MAADDFTVEHITWHRPRPSYDPTTRLLSADDIATLSECELVVGALTTKELAAWICDLIATREALDITLHATMDALHRTLTINKSLQARIRTLMQVEPDDES